MNIDASMSKNTEKFSQIIDSQYSDVIPVFCGYRPPKPIMARPFHN